MKKRTGLTLGLILGLCVAQAQTTIRIQNPSFEWDEQAAGTVPAGWIDMGSEQESPPDIQPGSFWVSMKPADGKNYVGMVVRDNNTWEGIGQKLDGWMRKDSAYAFSVHLARSSKYESYSRLTGNEVNYNAPTMLKIWGVNTRTGEEELLAESIAVTPGVWTNFTFQLRPLKADYDEIDLIAYYAPGHEKKNGNLLIDNCSDITEIKE